MRLIRKRDMLPDAAYLFSHYMEEYGFGKS